MAGALDRVAVEDWVAGVIAGNAVRRDGTRRRLGPATIRRQAALVTASLLSHPADDYPAQADVYGIRFYLQLISHVGEHPDCVTALTWDGDMWRTIAELPLDVRKLALPSP